MIFLLQALVPAGFLILLIGVLGDWPSLPNNPSLFKILSVVLGLAVVLAWVGAALLWPQRHSSTDRYVAAGCIALPVAGIFMLVSAFIIVTLLAPSSLLTSSPFVSCIGGLMPLGALAYMLNRRR